MSNSPTACYKATATQKDRKLVKVDTVNSEQYQLAAVM